MSEIKWIKIVVDIFDDDKIKMIETLPDSDTIIVVWFKLLTLAGKKNDNGLIYITRDIPYDLQTLSKILNRPFNTVKLAIETFKKFKMIEIINDIIVLLNWDKHQSLDKMELYKQKNRDRVAEYRKKQKDLCNVTSNVTSNITVTECNARDIDKIRLDKINKELVNFSNEKYDGSIDSDITEKKVKKEPVTYTIKGKTYTHQEVIKEFETQYEKLTEKKIIWTPKEIANLTKVVRFFEKNKQHKDLPLSFDLGFFFLKSVFGYYDKMINYWNIAPTPSIFLKYINDIIRQ